jgi:hypothetical protein
MQYYDLSGNATLTANIGEGKYSFSDSPQLSSTSPDAPPLAFANTSLRLDRILDLKGISTNAVILLQYNTKYRIGPNSTARVEVSSDGGFTWSQTGMTTGVTGYSFNSPNISNSVLDPNPFVATAWQLRSHNLNSYRDNQILIRFRLDRMLESCQRSVRAGSGNDNAMPTKCVGNGGGEEYTKGYFDGWWISRLTVSTQ